MSRGQVGQTNNSIALGALQQSNTNAYLTMLLAQEKVHAQLATLGGLNNVANLGQGSVSDMQNQFLQAQQRQLEYFHQQRLLMAQQQALRYQQQQQGGEEGSTEVLRTGMQSHLGQQQQQQQQQQQHHPPQENGSGGGKNKPKRASAA